MSRGRKRHERVDHPGLVVAVGLGLWRFTRSEIREARADMHAQIRDLRADMDRRSIAGAATIRNFAIVAKDETDGWALVALTNDGAPALGIRWFVAGRAGFPQARGNPCWFVMPAVLAEPIVESLPLEASYKVRVRQFLRGLIAGEDLAGRDGHP